MSSISDLTTLPDDALQEEHRTLRSNVVAMELLLRDLSTAVSDPAKLESASELLGATRAYFDWTGPRDREEIKREVGLANAALLAVVDLVKAHADGTRGSHAKTGPAKR